jgi:hypothetical protein
MTGAMKPGTAADARTAKKEFICLVEDEIIYQEENVPLQMTQFGAVI